LKYATWLSVFFLRKNLTNYSFDYNYQTIIINLVFSLTEIFLEM